MALSGPTHPYKQEIGTVVDWQRFCLMARVGIVANIRCSHNEMQRRMDAETYLAQRFEPQLAWLAKASRTNKSAYLRYRLFGIGLGAVITILSPYADKKYSWNGIPVVPLLLQLCGAGVALSGAMLALNQHQENWLRYRSLKEALEREKWLYCTGSSEAYSGSSSFQQFVCTAEQMMGDERSRWLRQTSAPGNHPAGDDVAEQRDGTGAGSLIPQPSQDTAVVDPDDRRTIVQYFRVKGTPRGGAVPHASLATAIHAAWAFFAKVERR